MKCIEVNYDITIIEGGTYDKIFQWKTGDPAIAVDISGYTADGMIRTKLKAEPALLELPYQDKAWVADGDTGIYILQNDEYDEYDDETGKFRIYIKDNDTLGLCSNHKDITGVYDLFLYNPLGESVFKMYGVATIKATATRVD
jgi:hypothetical protein